MTVGIRRVSYVPAPISGESLTSWVRAVADDTGTSIPVAAQMLGLATRGPSAKTFAGLLAGVPSDRLAEAEAVTGIGTAALAPMTFQKLTELMAGPLPTAAPVRTLGLRTAGLNHTRSAFCPHRLASNGGRWSLGWRIRWVFMCVEHGVVLTATCPEGHQAQEFTGYPQRDHCLKPPCSGGRQCPERFADATAHRVRDGRLVAIQRSITAAFAAGSLDAQVGETGVSMTQFLSVVHLVAYRGHLKVLDAALADTDADIRRRWRDRDHSRGFGDPMMMAAYCLIAAQLLAEGGFEAAVAALLGPEAQGRIPVRWIRHPDHARVPTVSGTAGAVPPSLAP